LRVSIIVEDSPSLLAEKVNFFIKDMTEDNLVDIKFTTDVDNDVGSWYNAMIIYKKV